MRKETLKETLDEQDYHEEEDNNLQKSLNEKLKALEDSV
jgi:hypothetical protein